MHLSVLGALIPGSTASSLLALTSTRTPWLALPQCPHLPFVGDKQCVLPSGIALHHPHPHVIIHIPPPSLSHTHTHTHTLAGPAGGVVGYACTTQ